MSETKFNPREFASVADMPAEQQENFESLEGGKGFVLKTVERDPQIAHSLAILEERAMGELKSRIETRGRSFDDLLVAYKEAADKRDYNGKRDVSEALKEMSDYAILHGGDYDPELKKTFEKSYEQLNYSRVFQDSLVANLPKEDPEVIAKAALDPKFSSRTYVVHKIDDEAVLQKVYELTKSDLSMVGAVVMVTKKLDSKVAILKDIVAVVNAIEDPKIKAQKLGDFSFQHMKGQIANDLARSKDYDTLFALIDQDTLGHQDVKDFLPSIPSDELLYEFARRFKTWPEAARAMKHMKNKESVLKVAEACQDDADFRRLPPAERTALADAAARFYAAFTNKPNIQPLGQLLETKKDDRTYDKNVENKFIVGLKAGEDRLTIAWSSTLQHNQHKDQFDDLSYRRSDQDFPEALRSGGFLVVENLSDGKARVKFNERSGDFGPYNKAMLEPFKDEIAAAISKGLKKEIEFIIEVSGR